MQLTIESPTPLDRSVTRRLSRAYWAQRGVAAWRSGEVPQYSTSNLVVARQHAALLGALVEDLEEAGSLSPTDPVWVLEGGCGSGLFAANLLAALEESSAHRGLLDRLRYLLTDCSEHNLREVIAQPRLARWHDAGTVVPALLDLDHPEDLAPLDPDVEPGPLAAVITSYVSCVLPVKNLQRWEDGGWRELRVEVRADVEDPEDFDREAWVEEMAREATRHNLLRNLELHFDWAGVPSLEEVLGDPVHAAVVEHAVDGMSEATLGYPHGYFEFLRRIAPRMLRGGAVLTVDYGSPGRRRLARRYERRPQIYGNSINQDIDFAVYDGLGPVLGWEVLRTRSELDSVHAALVTYDRFGPRVREVFEERYLAGSACDALLDASAAGRVFFQRKEYGRALRFYLRCAEMDPHNPEFRYRVGDVAIEGGYYDVAIEHLERGRTLEGSREWSFEFALGRATCLSGRYRDAIAWYEASLDESEHPVTYTNLGVLHEHLGDLEAAWRAFTRTLEIDEGNERATQRLAHLREGVWRRQVAEWEARAATESSSDG